MRRKQIIHEPVSRRRLLWGAAVAFALPTIVTAKPEPTGPASGSLQGIRGAGATLPARLYSKWGKRFNDETGHSFRYASVGSERGWDLVAARQVDFGTTELPNDSVALEKARLIQFPVANAPIVLIANLPGLSSKQIRLTPSLVADILLARIRYWRHPDIRQINPDVTIPDLAITPVSRLGQSGTTYALTRFLTHTAVNWRSAVGITSTPVWAYGLLAKGTSALEAVVARTPGAFGYQVAGRKLPTTVSLVGLGYPQLGFFEAPTKPVEHTRWPLATMTYALLPYEEPRDLADLALTLRFFSRGFTSWHAITKEAGFSILEPATSDAVFAQWHRLGLPSP